MTAAGQEEQLAAYHWAMSSNNNSSRIVPTNSDVLIVLPSGAVGSKWEKVPKLLSWPGNYALQKWIQEHPGIVLLEQTFPFVQNQVAETGGRFLVTYQESLEFMRQQQFADDASNLLYLNAVVPLRWHLAQPSTGLAFCKQLVTTVRTNTTGRVVLPPPPLPMQPPPPPVAVAAVIAAPRAPNPIIVQQDNQDLFQKPPLQEQQKTLQACLEQKRSSATKRQKTTTRRRLTPTHLLVPITQETGQLPTTTAGHLRADGENELNNNKKEKTSAVPPPMPKEMTIKTAAGGSVTLSTQAAAPPSPPKQLPAAQQQADLKKKRNPTVDDNHDKPPWPLLTEQRKKRQPKSSSGELISFESTSELVHYYATPIFSIALCHRRYSLPPKKAAASKNKKKATTTTTTTKKRKSPVKKKASPKKSPKATKEQQRPVVVVVKKSRKQQRTRKTTKKPARVDTTTNNSNNNAALSVQSSSPGVLPRGVTQRASGKWVRFGKMCLGFVFLLGAMWVLVLLLLLLLLLLLWGAWLTLLATVCFYTQQQAQVYFAGASRYVGVFDSSREAANAYTHFKSFLSSYREGASQGIYSKEYLSQLIDLGRQHAMNEVGVAAASALHNRA